VIWAMAVGPQAGGDEGDARWEHRCERRPWGNTDSACSVGGADGFVPIAAQCIRAHCDLNAAGWIPVVAVVDAYPGHGPVGSAHVEQLISRCSFALVGAVGR